MRLPVLSSSSRSTPLDAERAELARSLAELLGDDGSARDGRRVRFGEHDRMLYSTDASLYQVEPIGVVVPGDVNEAERVVRWCGKRGVALLPRGGGTSLAGQCTNHALVMDLSASCRQVDEIVELPDAHTLDASWVARSGFGVPSACVTSDAGVTVDELNRVLTGRGAGGAGGAGVFFAPDPATTAQATVGGCIGNNAAGARSIRYGRTSENLLGVEAVLTTGERLWLEAGAGARNAIALRLARGVVEIVRRYERLIRERYPKTLRQNAGYGLDRVLAQLDAGATVETLDLSALLAGSEGTLAATLRARLALRPLPTTRALAVLSFATLEDAIAAVKPILDECLGASRDGGLSAVELLDDVVLDAARGNLEYRQYVDMLPGADAARGTPKAVLYVEFFGFVVSDSALQQIRRGYERLRAIEPSLRVVGSAFHTDAPAMLAAWKLRKAGEPLLHGLPGARKPITFVEDNAVPVERLSEFVRGFKEIVTRHGTRAAYWAHASVGVLHVRPMIDLHDEADRVRMRGIAAEVAELARSLGGVMSGEHGDGRVRGPLLPTFFGHELVRAFGEVKRLFDPRGLLNPGNIVEPLPIETMTDNLRTLAGSTAVSLGSESRATTTDTYYTYEDQHGFLGAAEMCNGAGVCRKRTGGTMCPSYMGTMDERHATRGRGNALRLAITGQIGRDAANGRLARGPVWNDPGTLDTLRLCLSCKACKSECPSNVDIARLKAEYTAQGFRARGGAPLAARITGNVRVLNRLGSMTPGLANWFNRLRPTKWLLARTLGIDPRRDVPRFERSLYAWMKRRHKSGHTAASHGKVVLFADCFTVYNEPRIGAAAVDVLERLGYEVVLLPGETHGGFAASCCGRAAISMGVLDDALGMIDAACDGLTPALDDPEVRAIVYCEPSCLSAVKDDWLQLTPRTPLEVRTRIADRSMLVEDFVGRVLAERGAAFADDDAAHGSRVVLHGHCHQKALWGDQTSSAALRRVAGDGRVAVLDAGCCGMAGSFGYSRDRYDLSMKIGELRLMPSVREAIADDPSTVVVAPGTSCRHQIHDATGTRALHPIEYIARRMGQFSHTST